MVALDGNRQVARGSYLVSTAKARVKGKARGMVYKSRYPPTAP